MDLQDHGDLGVYGCGDGLCADTDAVLHRAVFAGSGGSRFFSRRNRLFNALVPFQRSSSRDLVFLDCLAACDDDWAGHFTIVYRYRQDAPCRW